MKRLILALVISVLLVGIGTGTVAGEGTTMEEVEIDGPDFVPSDDEIAKQIETTHQRRPALGTVLSSSMAHSKY